MRLNARTSAVPARYAENVELALRLLGKQKLPAAMKVGHVVLVALLDSGIPIKMPGRKELNLGVLRPEKEACWLGNRFRSATRQPAMELWKSSK